MLVLAAGLDRSDTATTVRFGTGGGRSVTDGPFAETKEWLAGFWVIECADLDEALGWVRRAPMEDGKIEVRPLITERDDLMSRVRAARRARSGRSATASSTARSGEESGRAVAALIRVLGDFDAAEEAVQDAFLVALERWPRDGVARQPGRLDRPGRPQPGDRPAAAGAHPARQGGDPRGARASSPAGRAARRPGGDAAARSRTTACG